MKSFLGCLFLLVLAGCATTPPPAAAPQACSIQKAAEIPITFERGFISAPAVIDDQPVKLLIDTGSETSLVTPLAMQLLRLPPDAHRRTNIEGAGGTITSQNAFLQSFDIGGMEMLNQSAAVGDLPAAQNVVMTAAGLIGADWLRDFDVELDLRHKRMALYRADGCEGDYVPWPGQKTSVVAQIYRAGLVILSVRLDGQPVSAVLDSGAARSALSATAAARIGVGPSVLARDPSGTSRGVDGTRLDTHMHRFGQLRVGDSIYTAPLISVAPLRLPVADMLLGLDWLGDHRVWISYESRRVTIQSYPAAP